MATLQPTLDPQSTGVAMKEHQLKALWWMYDKEKPKDAAALLRDGAAHGGVCFWGSALVLLLHPGTMGLV